MATTMSMAESSVQVGIPPEKAREKWNAWTKEGGPGMGLKFVLLISRKVEPFARLTISSCATLAQSNRKRLGVPGLGIIAMKP